MTSTLLSEMAKIYAGQLVDLGSFLHFYTTSSSVYAYVACTLRNQNGRDSSKPLTPAEIRDAFYLLREEKGEGPTYASAIHQTLGGGGGISNGPKGRRIGIGR